jgi:hypothetical protein
MRRVLQLTSWVALVATIAPPLLFLNGSISLDQTKLAMLIATLVWFVATPLWMGRAPHSDSEPL